MTLTSAREDDVQTIVRTALNATFRDRLEAFRALEQLCRRSIRHKIAVGRAGAIEAVLLALEGDHVSELEKHASRTLWELSVLDELQSLIGLQGGIRTLLRRLNCHDPTIQEHAANTLSNLALCDENKSRIVAEGGIGPLMTLLSSPSSSKLRLGALLSLYVLSGKKDLLVCLATEGVLDAALSLVPAAAIEVDVFSVQIQQYASWIICNFALHEAYRHKILEGKGVACIAQLVGASDAQVQLIALSALLGFAPSALPVAGNVGALVAAATSTHEEVQVKAALLLSKLAGVQREVLVECGFVPRLVSLATNASPQCHPHVAQAFHSLSTSSGATRVAMVQQGAVSALSRLVASGNTYARVFADRALANLAPHVEEAGALDAARRQKDLELAAKAAAELELSAIMNADKLFRRTCLHSAWVRWRAYRQYYRRVVSHVLKIWMSWPSIVVLVAWSKAAHLARVTRRRGRHAAGAARRAHGSGVEAMPSKTGALGGDQVGSGRRDAAVHDMRQHVSHPDAHNAATHPQAETSTAPAQSHQPPPPHGESQVYVPAPCDPDACNSSPGAAHASSIAQLRELALARLRAASPASLQPCAMDQAAPLVAATAERDLSPRLPPAAPQPPHPYGSYRAMSESAHLMRRPLHPAPQPFAPVSSSYALGPKELRRSFRVATNNAAARIIQAAFRALLARRRAWRLGRSLAEELASHARWLMMNACAAEVQRMWRGHAARSRLERLFGVRSAAAVELQRRWRGYRVRSILQPAANANAQHRRQREIDAAIAQAAHALQRCMRRWLVGLRAAQRRSHLGEASVRVQRWWRGALGRKAVARLRREWRLWVSYIGAAMLEHQAAIVVQSMVRMYLVTTLRRALTAAAALQSAAQQTCAAATAIARCWRRHRVRDCGTHRRAHVDVCERIGAAIMVQKTWRGHRGRRCVEARWLVHQRLLNKMQAHPHLKRAAAKIQLAWLLRLREKQRRHQVRCVPSTPATIRHSRVQTTPPPNLHPKPTT